jgi:hypothetical protein
MKKITVLMAMLALAMFAALPAFAQDYTITVDEGDVEITTTSEIIGSIVQNCGASVSFGDENANVQVVENSQNADIEIDGSGNEVAFEQSLSQSGFSPEVSTECTQSVAQAASGFFHHFF